MKTYFDETNSNCMITINNLKELNNIIKGLKLLNKEITKITTVYRIFIDIDTKYYKRYNDSFIQGFYNYITNNIIEIIYKNNRLYTIYKDTLIILPAEMYNIVSNNKELTLKIEYK